ncbi:MAG: TonB-dependent receptor [Pseudomonadota bacterium]
MNTFRPKGNRSAPMQRRRKGDMASAAAGCAIFLVGGAGTALAQQQVADSEEIGEVVVTGLRKSIQDAISVKKSSSSIVESISAEDIGKLPDSSIAESIARLPGIAAQRTNGRAQTLSIRGLGPDFTVTTFNGREQATTNDNRTVEFDQYPSELVTQVNIYKTPDAGMAYQGIAGTTDVQTVHPLAYDSRRTVVSYRREQNAQDANIPGLEDAGNRANLTYIDQFRDHTLGVAFGVAYNKSPYQAQTREPWGYADSPTGPGEKIIGGDKDGVQSSFYERMGYMGVVEFAPNDQLHMLLDVYHSDFKELQTIQRIEYGTIWAGATLTNPGPLVKDRIQSGTFTNVPFVVIENYNNDRRANIDSIGLNTDYALTDNWNLNADLSYSKVERDDLRVESTAGLGTNNDPELLPPAETVSFTTDPDGISHLSPTLNYSDYGSVFLTDPGAWGGGPRRSGFVGHPEINDEIKAIRLSAERKIGTFLENVKFGVNYAERVKSKENFQSVLYLPGDISHAVVPEEFRTGIANTSFFGSPYGMIGYDAIGLYNSGFWQPIDAYDDPNPAVGSGDRQSSVTNDWRVTEKLTTAFVKFGIDTHIGKLPLRGNIGVQSITADQSSDLNLYSPACPEPTCVPALEQSASMVTQGTKYTDILPSMNLALELPHDMKLRFGAAITQARPRMDELAGGAGYTVVPDSATPPNVDGQFLYWSRNGGGNPNLKPWKATTFDLSFEKYFAEQGYVSLAVYNKNLTTYIATRSVITSFEGVLLPDQQLPTDPTIYTEADANRNGVSSVKVNGSGGYIRGVELTVSLPFSLFTPVLDGFGLVASAAKNESEILINDIPTDVPGLSTKVFNTTLYFEKAGFSARVSNRFRGDFLGEVPDYSSNLTFNNVKSESILDAQVGYEFRQGTLEGLSVSLQGTNLTDEPFVLSAVGEGPYNLVKYQKYGAVYSLALTYKF